FAAVLVMVNVSDVVAFNEIVAGLNALAIDGGATTVTLADAAVPVPPSFDVTELVVLFCNPAAVPVTFTENVQDKPDATVPPLRLITLVFCVAVTVPPHEFVSPLGVEIISPAGSVSLKAIPLNATVVFELLMPKVSEVDPFSGIEVAPNNLLSTGGDTTVI